VPDSSPDASPHATLGLIRRLMLLVLVLGLVGTGTELLLIGHDEDVRQMVPLAAIALALGALAWQALSRRAAAVRLLRVVMLLCIASGVAGVVLHFQSNAEFQLEIDPSLGAMALFWKVMQAKAPPALAPASMAQLGILGLAYTVRHPLLARSGRADDDKGA